MGGVGKVQRKIDEVGLAPEDLIKVLEIKAAHIRDFLPTVSGMSFYKGRGRAKILRKEIERLKAKE